MNDIAAVDVLIGLSRVGRAALDVETLLTDALALLRELAGADGAMVLRPSGDGFLVVTQAGVSLDHDAAPAGVLAVGHRLIPVEVPPAWSAVGVERAAARRLPADAGVVVLAWAAGSGADEVWLEPALAMLDEALSRVQAEERLSDLMVRVDNAQQLANMGDYDWHIATDTNRWSDQLYRIYGHEPQSFNAAYDRFIAQIHPDDRERIMGIHERAYASGEPYQMIERIVRPDGQTRYLSSNGQVVRDAAGNPVRMRGTCIDVTDRILAEQDREHTAARFRSLVESNPDAILVVDRTGRIVQANRTAAELLGADPVGHALDELALPSGGAGQGIVATGLDARPLQLDVSIARLSQLDDEGLVAVFLHDAGPRLASEALAAALREVQVRRRQALEINDNVVQGLTAALYSLAAGNVANGTSYLERTLSAARRMMNDWLDPLDGDALQPGDLVRDAASSLAGETATDGAPAPLMPAVALPRVLIVDDNTDVRLLLRANVESAGRYDVVGEADDGVEAVRMAAELRPDVVLLDLAMPRMDGLQALPLIRDAVPGVRVIVLSGFDENAMADTALAAGAARYVEKGVRLDLPDVIDAVLSPA